MDRNMHMHARLASDAYIVILQFASIYRSMIHTTDSYTFASIEAVSSTDSIITFHHSISQSYYSAGFCFILRKVFL